MSKFSTGPVLSANRAVMTFLRVMILLVIGCFAGDDGMVNASQVLLSTSIEANDVASIRNFSSSPSNAFLLTFGAIKSIDRTVVHFELPERLDDIQSAALTFALVNSDPDLPLGDLDIYSFYGDGIVSGDQWDAGRLYHRITDIAGEDLWEGGDRTGPRFNTQVLELNVLPLLGPSAEQHDFVSFVFRPGQSTDRYFTGVGLEQSSIPDPTLIISRAVPEPSTFPWLVIGLTFVLRRRVS